MPSSVHAVLSPYQLSSSPPTSFPGYHATYSKAILSLRDILENELLRKGNYLILSSPENSPVRITLHRGKLTFIMPQQVYQRSGLTFPSTRLPSGGRKHEKNSALQKVEVDLRQPSMMTGRKGFDRLMYAAKNVDGLREARVYLCVDLEQQLADVGVMRGKKRKREDNGAGKSSAQNQGDVSANTGTSSNIVSSTPTVDNSHNRILSKHHPTHVTHQGTTSLHTDVLVPPIFKTLSTFYQSSHSRTPANTTPSSSILEDDMHEIIEYLSFLFLESPQLTKQQYGRTDPYISQYRLPDPSISFPQSQSTDTVAQQQQSQECNGVGIPAGTKVEDLQIIKYEGLISNDWMVQLVIDLIRRSRAEEARSLSKDAWIVIKAEAHVLEPVGAKDGYMIVLHGAEENDTVVKDDRAGDVLVDKEEEGSGVEEMVVHSGNGTIDHEKTITVEKEAKTSSRGFSSVTCFEFIDSFN